MAVRHSTLTYFLCVFLAVLSTAACVKVRGPGIMPPVEDTGYLQWDVLSRGFLMVRTNSGEKQWQWHIIARFWAESDDRRLKPLDISATVDGAPVPFTFEERGQIFESATSPDLSPGTHRFELVPSESSSQPFPTLTVDFEAP